MPELTSHNSTGAKQEITEFMYLCPLHGICKIHARNVPAAQHNVIWVHHWQKLAEWNIHLFSLVVAHSACGSLSQWSPVVWLLDTFLCHPSHATVNWTPYEDDQIIMTRADSSCLGTVSIVRSSASCCCTLWIKIETNCRLHAKLCRKSASTPLHLEMNYQTRQRLAAERQACAKSDKTHRSLGEAKEGKNNNICLLISTYISCWPSLPQPWNSS